MKISTIHSIRLKFIAIMALLLTFAHGALAQSGSWTDSSNMASGYDSGAGSQTDPYVIKTASQLAYFANQVKGGKDRYAYVTLGADIDLAGHWWTPIGPYNGNNKPGGCFEGVFDGKGYTISNLNCNWGNISVNEYNRGLFTWLTNTTVRNLIIDSAHFQNNEGSMNHRHMGILAAGTSGTVKIENIIIRNSKIDLAKSATMADYWPGIGGLVGIVYDGPTIVNCYVDVDIDLRLINASKKVDQLWAGMVIGGIDDSKQAKLKNVFAAGRVRIDEDRSGNSVGTMTGFSKSPSTTYNDNCIYQYTPTYGADNATLTTYGKQGTQKTFSSSEIIADANNYADSQNDLLSWKARSDGKLYFAGNISTDLTENYTKNEKTTSYVFTCSEPITSITWQIDGTVVSPDEGNGNCQITIPLSKKIRQGKITAIIGDETVTRTFEIYPKKYSVDLYADQFAGGTGTKDDPYQISNDMELAKLAYDVNNGSMGAKFNGSYFVLTNDISLDDALWMPIGDYDYKGKDDTFRHFAGKLNGNGHAIKGMQIYWDDQYDYWSVWGLFATLKGASASEAAFCSVNNLIIDGARMEKRPGVTPITQGINAGLIVGEMYPYTDVSNIIIKNSKISDNEETYTSMAQYHIGGIIGNVKKGTGIYRIYNISVGVDLNLFKNATINESGSSIAGAIARADMASAVSQTNNVYPANIYVHGGAIDNKSGSSCYMGSIIPGGGFFAPLPTANQSATWYYVNAQTGANVRNDGNQKALSDFGVGFAAQTNGYIQNNLLEDLLQWVYTDAEGFNFGNTELKLEQTDVNIITANTPNKEGVYSWYVSQDRQNWTLQKDSEGNTLYSPSLTLPYVQYDRYVYAVLQDGSSSSKAMKVPGLRFTATLKEQPAGTYNINVTNTIWNTDNSRFDISYSWQKNDVGVGNDSPSYTPGSINANDVISCVVVIKDKQGKEIYSHKVYKATVVYLCPAGATVDGTDYAKGEDNIDDSEWGYSPEKPMLTWKGAYQKLQENASWTENVIVLMGRSEPAVTNDATTGFSLTRNYRGAYYAFPESEWEQTLNSPLRKKATITGKWDNVDYNGIIETGGDCNSIALWEDTRFENITFNRKAQNYDILFCQYYNLEMGEGIKMTNYLNSPQYGTLDGAKTASFQIFGGLNDDGRFYPLNTKENIKKMEEAFPHKDEGFSITIKSGHYSCICAGGRQATNAYNMNGMMGSPKMPIKCTINIDINTAFNDEQAPLQNSGKADYDVGIVLAGNHEGAMYGDVDINILSGRVARVVNGTLGNNRDFKFSYDGKEYIQPYNSYMGRANILIDPASSEHAKEGETEKNINDRVVITELYGGSAGRGFDANVKVDNPFYGYSTVTINGGTFKILPEGNTETDKINAGIYGAGAGGMNGIGDDSHFTPDTRIAFWSPDSVMLYGDYATAKNNLIKYRCYNSDTHSYTYVDPTETNTKIVINGGVFGSESVKIDGIYAGGSGYMTRGLFTNTTAVPNVNGGNIYGKAGQTVASLTINGGTFYCKNGIFAGGRGTDYYYSTNKYGATDAAAYTDLGKIYGNVEMDINGGEFHSPIFGGGYGVADAELLSTKSINTLSNMARLYGKSTINIYGGTFYDNIYGGGDMAVVEYDGDEPATNVNIYNSTDIRGSVFGGGNGRMARDANSSTINNDTQSPDIVGKVIGSTNVTTIGESKNAPYIYGDIYGGGNLAQVGFYTFDGSDKEPVGGNTNVNLYAGNFAGQIFGGGNGLLWEGTGKIRNSADIAGNSFVTLAQDQGGQEEGDDGERIDNFSINVIWDQLWDAQSNQFYVWDTETNRRLASRDNMSRERVTVDKTRFYDENKGKFLNPHNIYGGGNLACNVGGRATVTVLKGMTPFELLKTSEWKASYIDNNNPHFYVFGGGYGEKTSVANTDVTVDVEGDYGIYNAEAGDGDEQLAKPNNGSLFDDESSFGGVSTPSLKKRRSARKAQASTTLPVFDNSKGIPNFTILGVLGGGYSGIVTGNTKVTVDGNTFLHRVYGGGFGDPTSTIDNTTGQVKGSTEVYVQGANIYGDVFGGGAGVRRTDVNATPFMKVAEVIGTTMVEISDDAKVYGRVYGGGDIANVGEYLETKPANYYDPSLLQSISTLDQTPAKYTDQNTTACTLISYEAKGYRSFVNVIGGDIFGNVYGGGKGLTKAKTIHYDKVGRINGNTLVHIANSTNNSGIELQEAKSSIASNSIDPNGNIVPYIWNRIYGGCAYGTVDGNTLVHIEGGMLGLNVFGGGYGDVDIENDMTNEDSGASTDASTLEQVLGKKDTENKGTYANILGNTKVLIDGGSWIWNKRGDVNGNILTWVGVEDGKNKICNSEDEFKEIVAAINSAKTIDDITNPKAKAAINTIKNNEDTKEFFDINTGLFRKNLNIFGGGNRACYVGTYTNGDKPLNGTGDAVVEINHSPLADIYDDNGKLISLLDATTLQGLCWYLCSKVTSHPQFSVFGAGYGANTKVGNAYVYARPGARVNSSDGMSLDINNKVYRYLNHRSDMQKYYAKEQEYWNDFLKVSKEDKKKYYGSSDGGNADGTDNDTKTYGRYRASRWAWSLGAPCFTFLEIHGGGFSGYVTGDTYVEADCQLACRNLYGAGLGAKPYGTFTKGDDYDFGSVGGDSKVFFKSGNVSLNVYGGGAGVESVRVSGSEIVDKNAKTGEIVDFPNMARVNGKTKVSVFGETITYENTVKMERTLIFGSVYGGGDVANVGLPSAKTAATQIGHDAYIGAVDCTSMVNIRGGQLFSQVFAGGRGRAKDECADYTKLGGIYGNAFIIVDRPMNRYPYLNDKWESINPWGDGNMAHPDDGVNEDLRPYVWNRVYGGCESGTVYGNTLVAINDGHFGYNIFGGGWGSCDTTYVNNQEVVSITSADVTGNTNMIINGGETALTSYWRAELRSWEPSDIISGHTYSPQYDHDARKFKINHNIYAGGNTACVVGEKDADGNLVSGSGNTYLTMTKGMLYDNTQVVTGQTDDVKFFERDEWKEVYDKPGSPHFAVFGGGFGENTLISGDTHLNIQMQGRGSITDFDIKEGEEYKHFLSGYSIMDMVGGGYNGKVAGETHIIGDGGVFCRRIFGGGFYNSVKATNVEVNAVDCRDIFGGGLMGDVEKNTSVNIGSESARAETIFTNNDIYIHGSIYGGNDVSGYVNVVLDKNGYFADNGGTGTNINIYGGNIFGNVYGAGNGDYLYALDREGHDKVTVNEYYPLNPNDPDSEKEPLVYTVPMRETMPSYKAASDAAKIVNINSWRPMTNKVSINIKGEADEDGKRVVIKGDVYGGGNSATVQKVQSGSSAKAAETVGDIKLNIGSHVRIGRVFMGCNGDELFTASEDNDFMNKFQKLNGDQEDFSVELNLADSIDWANDPSNKGISTLWLSTNNNERPIVYPHLLDLYFQPVETDIQGKLKWNGSELGESLTDCVIGTFCCGGNRGNMNVYPLTASESSDKAGNVVEYTFPAGLTITDKIVGGCNNANYDYKGRVSHEGGYLLGEIHTQYPFIKLNVKNHFDPNSEDGAYKGGNVYGGCYKSGTIRGDVSIDMQSDMLEGKSKAMLEKSNELVGSNADYSAFNVYGAGYGMESYVWGNTHILFGEGVNCSEPTTTKTTSADGSSEVFNASGTSANFVYGGGQQGNVIGKTYVEMQNGHVFKSITGGSYSGYVWGSTQVKVGYPKYYIVNPGYGGIFKLNRTDQNNKDIDAGKKVSTETIKQEIRIMNDDVITQSVYDAITKRYDGLADSFYDITDEMKPTYFREVAEGTPTVGWDNVNIKIGEAVYGGGYSLAQGSSVMANNTTVLKYTDDHNLDRGFDTEIEKEILKKNLNGSTNGFGGNTTILIGDRTTAGDNDDRDHITISRQDMKVANVADGQDLLGYYYKDKGETDKDGNVTKAGTYHYIYQAGTYYKGGKMPDNCDGTDVYEYDNEGGIFGDGHLSYAQGFRCADLTGYGFASTTVSTPKILNTFQRMDILRLTDNCFSLLGARDYATNAMDKTPYSISRLGEIQMYAKNINVSGNQLGDSYTVRSRNYMGFANNIHYLGALYSNVAFSDEWHDGDGKTGDAAMSYKDVKQKYIDDYYGAAGGDPAYKDIDYFFEKRNDGTARNMIGIASGYALKIQNAQEEVGDNEEITEKLYYGPVYGVIEMNLIDIREDEGGGYVYADNVHKRGDDDTHAKDFLETTGNFVFPYIATQGRYIVDDCFPVGYSDERDPDADIPAHYWYVTGFNYHYTAHITGYTFDSSHTLPRQFKSNNLDGIVALSGLKPKQDVKIESWKMYSAHTEGYECDLEQRNYTDGALDIEDEPVKDGYTLHVGAANSLTYLEPAADGAGFAAKLSMKENASANDCQTLKSSLPDNLPDGDAKIVFQLEDMVNNTTSDYYNKHMSEPCKATLVMSAPALDDDNNPVEGYVAITKLYTRTAKGDDYEYTPITSGQLDANTEYFYKSGETTVYQKVNDKQFAVRDLTTGEYNNVDRSQVKLGDETIYYCYLERYYTYTVDLTIDYVQGPDIEGHITIENCALPGERIRVRKNNVIVKADQAFSVNGYYWRLGKRKKEGEDWVFDTGETKDAWSKYTTSKYYDTFNQSDEKTAKGLFEGCYYDKTEDYLEIPAYYFMNGYALQLGVTMNVPGLDDILAVTMVDADTLAVHNYHRMNPHKTGLNLHLAEAIKRAATEKGFAEPRIYISDQSDLTAFIQFVDSIGTTTDAPRYGKNAQFILQNDLTMATSAHDGTEISDFAGTFHGNGHVINGLAPGNCLLNSISGNVYNLGMSSGKISNMQPTNGKIAQYHCCYEYAPENPSSFDGVSTPSVYRMDGTLDTHYTAADFRLGRVAYDLNEYYLRARYSNETEADKLAQKYVYDYFANGDYQYASRTDAITGKTTGITYLRTGKDSDLPNYDQAETRHDRTHAIDKARAQDYVAATETAKESRSGDYLPLFNDNKNGTELMNDFLFWGQSLQSTPADYPVAITSHQLSNMVNRVYRTAAYYGDTTLSAFHYNAFNSTSSNMDTYVHIPTTTAIDFTCLNDLPKAIGINSGIYYTPVDDNATEFHDFMTKDGVTRNLLVYTATNDADTSNEAYDMVNKALNYDENTKETMISGHHVIKGNDETFSTDMLHLVERDAKSMNSEGETCDNNNFCAPIAFTVTNHAWYTRRPLYYANDNTGAWEGICLPFPVHKAVASLNGEITHFYGMPSEDEIDNPSTNTHTLHHEYWLRGIMSVADENGKPAATFQRPGETSSNLFSPVADNGTSLSESVSYTFDNAFFVDTYGSRLYNKDANPFYAESHIYNGYQLQSANVPYIIRFPGERYYEFDLSNAFYNNLFNRREDAQTITFNAYGSENENQQNYGTVTIPVTTTMATLVKGYSHIGTFSEKKVAEGAVYGMNATGTAFNDASTLSSVMPFRTYMAKNASGAKTRSIASSEILISEPADIDKIMPDLTPDGDEDSDNASRLVVRPIGNNSVRIESSDAITLSVYTTAGQLYKVLDVHPGTAVYDGFQPGAYIFGGTKVMVRK